MKRQPWQVYAAEALGTGVLVFIGCGSVLSDKMGSGAAGLVGISMAFGIAVAMMIFAVGPISGAHINPAVTVALAATNHFPRKQVLPYIGAQAAGAILASLLHNVVFTPAVASAAAYGSTSPTVSVASALGIEAVLTFILMFVIMAFATDSRAPGTMAAVAIGAVVVADIIVGGPATGASMNPARSLGPALFAGGAALSHYWLYVVGPIVGAVLAAFTYEALRERAADGVVVVEEPITSGTTAG
jgi:MIP family channel proteins